MYKQVEPLITEAIGANEELFLIDWDITSGNQISVVVDGDDGLSMEEIVRISRHIEHNLDREEYDFSLQVSSPGLSRPLSHPRQFVKNKGRTLKVTTAEEKYEGELIASTAEGVSLQWKQREPKPIGKGKHTVTKDVTIKFEDIEKATIKVKF